MKTLIDCDFVFEVLTRGPFPPTGQVGDDRRIDSHAIEAHLISCHECRQLAEALRPSVSIFHETLSEEERATLPAFNDSEMMDRLHSKIIEAVFESEEDPDRVERIDRVCKKWLAPAMVLVPIIAVTLLMCIVANPDLSTSVSSAMTAFSAGSNSQHADIRAMGLPDRCLTPVVMTIAMDLTGQPGTIANADQTCAKCHSMAATKAELSHASQKSCSECHHATDDHARPLPIDATHYHCCTACHAVGKGLPMGNVAKLTTACKTCHQ